MYQKHIRRMFSKRPVRNGTVSRASSKIQKVSFSFWKDEIVFVKCTHECPVLASMYTVAIDVLLHLPVYDYIDILDPCNNS